MITLRNVRKTFGTRRILDQVSFSVGAGQKVALVGPNGVGKSTLLKIIAGLEQPDKGEVVIEKRALIGYLSQEALAESGESLLLYLRRMTGLLDLEKEMRSLERSLDKPPVLERYEVMEAEYRRLGGYNFKKKAKKMLEGLRLDHIPVERKVAELSGGEKRKAALLGVLLRGVDLLLLDEPTNNLDLPALVWLEAYIKNAGITSIIASHDRRFLDNVVKKVLEVDWHKRNIVIYAGGWSEYTEMKAHRIRKQKELFRLQEEEKLRLYDSAAEKKIWAERTKTRKAPDHDKLTSNFKKERAIKKFDASAKSMEVRMRKLNKIEKPFERTPLLFDLPSSKEKYSLSLTRVRYGYPGGAEYGPLSLKIAKGERIAFLGANGAGKTTLLKTLTRELPSLSGKVSHSKHVVIGNLMQEHEDIGRSLTPFQLFDTRADLRDREKIQFLLARFQFSPDATATRIKDFSPGERVRLVLALLSVLGATVLVLDEPTNHLDLEAIEALESALEDYPGTVLLVSHDREFLKQMRIDRFFLVENGALSPLASYEDYVARIAKQAVVASR